MSRVGTLRIVLGSVLLWAACGESGYADRVFGVQAAEAGAAQAGDASVDASPPDSPHEPARCTDAVSSDRLPPRANVMAHKHEASAPQVFTRDLFSLFRSHCGGCHVDQGLGGLRVSLQNFPVVVTSKVLGRIRADDPARFMPPLASGGKPFSQRPPGDPVVELAGLLEAWLAAGSPSDVFYSAPSADDASAAFRVDKKLGMALTNLGSCIPAPEQVGSEQERSADLDAMFEKASELPEKLSDTDLHSLDSEVLAREGVISFAPGYTLWADNAKKMRYLRLPRGKSLVFDAATQSFAVPINTRVYKTFLKRVVDYRGNESYRKMETRVIVSRPDVQRPDGSMVPAALFGTYVWNDDETEAVLLRDPLRDGTPFRDRLITYVTDEQQADELISHGPSNLDEQLEEKGISRTYAVPGAARCVHCHMGAPGGSFVLGLTPLQLRRRPMGEGGVIEPSERDELNQLARLISYGVVTGLSSESEVALLEDSQGERRPRNEHELRAQGYMLGNCAHCHNPRGFPSQVAPELRDVLNFQPGPQGGIFQFPLDKFSPRILRGENRNLPIPYISPSIFDRPRAGESLHPDAKVMRRFFCEPGPSGDLAHCNEYIPAPWRSLIYRNVDTPFSYDEDSAIFPHMPMDTPGYDCRARQLMGLWMTSIPVRWKYSALGLREWDYVAKEDRESDDPQPFEEVFADDPRFEQAQLQSLLRVKRFRESPRFNDCPSPALDVVDPRVIRAEIVVPGPTVEWPVYNPQKEQVGAYSLRVPERAHWADTDLTQAPGDWNPRRPDWLDVLVSRSPSATRDERERQVVELLQATHITPEIIQLALQTVPFGLWLNKPECNFAGQQRVSDLTGSARPSWLNLHPGLKGDEPLYALSGGAMVFTSICANCHGPLADSQGRLAATIADMTGGQTRVANLRDGLFGPQGHPGDNITRVFGVASRGDASAREWAARYVLWMGLGGTQRLIPPAALAVVGTSSVLGEPRQGQVYDLAQVKDANMLSVAQVLCAQVLPRNTIDFDALSGHPDRSTGSALIARNGDAEMWERLCTLHNPLPVRVIEVKNQAGSSFRVRDFTQDGLIRRDRYPQGRPVGDPRTFVQASLSPDNPAPWCIKRPPDDYVAAFEHYWSTQFGESEPPLCPDGLVERENRMSEDDVTRWTTQGAINAGLAVFLYLDALTRGQITRQPSYDHCEDLRP